MKPKHRNLMLSNLKSVFGGINSINHLFVTLFFYFTFSLFGCGEDSTNNSVTNPPVSQDTVVSLIYPPNDTLFSSANSSVPITWLWHSIPGNPQYNLQSSVGDTNFSQGILLSDTTYTAVYGVPTGDTVLFYWRVRYTHDSVYSPWSLLRHFKVTTY